MKRIAYSLFILLMSVSVTAQNENQAALAQKSTEKLTQRYGLDAEQQAEMLKIQARKFRNLAEIEPFQQTDVQLYIQKVRALQFATDKSIEKMLKESQLTIHRQQQLTLREEKASAYKELRDAGASQQAIDQKMLELDLKALE